jgi:hypothetical protein
MIEFESDSLAFEMLGRYFTLKRHSIIIDIFNPLGEPISLHLLCCAPFAVEYHSFMGHASHLQQLRLVNDLY